jgi:hypothetical protein
MRHLAVRADCVALLVQCAIDEAAVGWAFRSGWETGNENVDGDITWKIAT